MEMDPQLWQVISDGGVTHSQIWNLEKWLECSHSENVDPEKARKHLLREAEEYFCSDNFLSYFEIKSHISVVIVLECLIISQKTVTNL